VQPIAMGPAEVKVDVFTPSSASLLGCIKGGQGSKSSRQQQRHHWASPVHRIFAPAPRSAVSGAAAMAEERGTREPLEAGHNRADKPKSSVWPYAVIAVHTCHVFEYHTIMDYGTVAPFACL
jgi:hypothetical protein